jgi:hypothetical protein
VRGDRVQVVHRREEGDVSITAAVQRRDHVADTVDLDVVRAGVARELRDQRRPCGLLARGRRDERDALPLLRNSGRSPWTKRVISSMLTALFNNASSSWPRRITPSGA